MTNPLIVPVEIEVYLVNSQMQNEELPDPYGRWELDFSDPTEISNPPEPYPFSGQPDIAPRTGAQVHWLVPDAFRAQRDSNGLFPLVPNRWMIVRSSRPPGDPNATPTFKAWVVESDHLEEYQSSYVYPWDGNYAAWAHQVTESDHYPGYGPGDYMPMTIGRVWEVQDWNYSRTDGDPLFLTAVGPGIMAFSGYQPYNQGVFSFYDDLHDIDPAQATLDYLVYGWFSQESEDILAGSEGVTALMDELDWTTSGAPDAMSLYAGAALRLEWNNLPNAPTLTGNRPDSLNQVFLAVGHNTADAATAPGLHKTDDVAAGRLFQAFLTGKFEQLDQNPAGFDDALHDTWFTPNNTDHAWQITDPPSGLADPLPDAELVKERNWLADLNTKQERYNVLARYASGLRFRLYELWRLSITPLENGFSNQGGRPESFNPTPTMDELAATLRAVLAEMTGIIQDQVVNGVPGIPGLPHGDTEQAFADSIAKYAGAWGLSPDGTDPKKVHRVLKSVPLPAFQTPNDPVVLLGGLWKDPAKKPQPSKGPLFCRTRDQLVASMLIGHQMRNGPLANPPQGWDHLPPGVQDAFSGLFAEFTLLSAAAATGTVDSNDLINDVNSLDPDTHVSPSFLNSAKTPAGPGHFTAIRPMWDQAWSPVYLLWQMQYYPVPLEGDNDYHWVFNPQSGRYELAKTATGKVTVAPLHLSGRCALTDVPRVLVGGGADRHIRTFPDAPQQGFEELVEKADEFGQISQTVEGLHRSLLQRLSGMGIIPNVGSPYREFLPDYPHDGFPAPAPDYAMGSKGPTLRFNPAGGAQFVFTFAGVVDSMGRHLTLIDANSEADSVTLPEMHPPYRAGSVTPSLADANTYLTFGDTTNPDTDDVHVSDPHCYLQLAPRILQPTRLRFDFVSTNDPYADGELVPPTVMDDPPEVATHDHPDATPVVGWLLANHLTGSLLIHDQHGRGIVEARKGIGISNGTEVPAVDWATLPYYTDPADKTAYNDDPFDTQSDFASQCPELFAFITCLRSNGPTAFDALMARIDAPTTAAQPPATTNTLLAPLIGQPVALIRARLTLETDTLPFTDPTWDKVLDFTTPDYLAQQWKWNIRLGGPPLEDNNVWKTTDGLIGYFTHKTRADGTIDPTQPTDYNVFRTPVGEATGYAQKIDARDLALPVNPAPAVTPKALDDNAAFDPTNPYTAFVTLLAHPWSDINAITDVLPTATLRLPDEDVRAPLSHLRIASRTGPLLAGTRPVPTGETGTGDDQVTAVVMPCPSAWKGIWDWSQPQPPHETAYQSESAHQDAQAAQPWDHYPITPTDNAAHLDQAPPPARTGYLTLTTAVGQTPPRKKVQQGRGNADQPPTSPPDPASDRTEPQP